MSTRIGGVWVEFSSSVIAATATHGSDALEVSLDFLVGKTSLELDTSTLNRMEEISKLPSDKKDYVFSLIDMALRDFKTSRAYA